MNRRTFLASVKTNVRASTVYCDARRAGKSRALALMLEQLYHEGYVLLQAPKLKPKPRVWVDEEADSYD